MGPLPLKHNLYCPQSTDSAVIDRTATEHGLGCRKRPEGVEFHMFTANRKTSVTRLLLAVRV